MRPVCLRGAGATGTPATPTCKAADLMKDAKPGQANFLKKIPLRGKATPAVEKKAGTVFPSFPLRLT
jgi:hypothetical protein